MTLSNHSVLQKNCIIIYNLTIFVKTHDLFCNALIHDIVILLILVPALTRFILSVPLTCQSMLELAYLFIVIIVAILASFYCVMICNMKS